MADYNLGTARGKIEIDASGAVRGSAEADSAIGKIGSKGGAQARAALGKIGAGAGIAGAAVAAGFAYAINKASDFEHTMSAVQAVSGATGAQMDQVRAKALQLGKDTVFSAGEAGQAIEELSKAGVTLPDIMNGAADATVNLAAAGGIDLPEAATIASNAMNQFGVSAKEMPKIADAIAGAANASAIDVHEFGYSLGQVGAVAHLAGLDFHDTAVAIAEMGNAGIKGSDAGTSLKSFLMNLIPTTQQQIGLFQDMGLQTFNATAAAKALAANGIQPLGKDNKTLNDQLQHLAAHLSGAKVGSAAAQKEFIKLGSQTGFLHNQFFKTNGEAKSLSKMQDVLANSTKGMTKEQKLATLQTLFGSDAIRAAAVMADNGAKGFDKMSTSMGKVTAADVAKKRMDNLSGSIEQLKGSLETAAIVIGEQVIPAVRAIVDFITKLINTFLNLPGPVKTAIIIITALGGAFLLIVGIILTMAVAFGALAATAGAADIALLPLIGTVALIAAGIIAFIAILVLVIKYHKQIWAAVVTAWNAIKNAIVTASQAVWNALKTAWNAIVGVVMGAVNAVVGFVQAHWQLLIAIIMGPFGIILGLVITHWNLIVSIFKTAWTVIKTIVLVGIGLVLLIIQQFLRPIKALFQAVWPAVVAIFRAAWNAIKAVVTAVWGVIKPLIVGGMNHIKNAVTTGVNALKSAWHAAWNAVKAVVQAVWNFIRPFVMTEIHGIINIIHGIQAVVAFVRGVFQNVYNAIVNAFQKVLGWLGGIAKKIIAPFVGAAKWLWNVGMNIIQGLWNGMKSIIGKVGGWLSDQVNHLKHLATHPWEILSPSKYMFRVGQYIMQGLALGLVKDSGKADHAMSNAMTKLGISAKDSAILILKGVNLAYKTGGEEAATTIATTLQHIGVVQGKELKVLSDAYRKWVNRDLMTALTGTKDQVQGAFDKINDIIKNIADARTKAAQALKDANKKVKEAQNELKDARDKPVKTKSERSDRDDAIQQAKKDIAAAQRAQALAMQDFEFAKANSKIAGQLHLQAQAAQKALTKIAHDREQLAVQISEATDALKAAQDQYDQYADEIAAKVTDTGALANFLNQTDAEGNAIELTVGNIITGMQSAIDQATSFAAQIDQLRKMGLSEDLINQIVEQGPEAGAKLATAIIAGGDEAIKQLNVLSAQLTAAAQALGKTQADAMYGAGVTIAQGLLKGLQSQEAALMAEANAIAAAITATIQKALKIKSPSRVMMGLGVNTIQGFIEGFASQMKGAQAQAAELASYAIAPGLPSSATNVGVSAARAIGGDGASLAGDTYHVGQVVIPAKDLAEMKSVSDFFDRVKQEARRGR
jgi:TP901 family phage tail tape measure protein